MTEARTDNDAGTPDAGRTKHYVRPTLTRFGHVPAITGSQGGSQVDPRNPFTGFTAPPP